MTKLILRLCQIAPGIVIAVMLSAFLVSPAMAAANNTAMGSLDLVPTFECLSVYANFTGDSNGNNSAILEYRESGTTTWIRGMDLTVDRRAQIMSNATGASGDGALINNPFVNQWRGSILGCDPASTYEVRVTFSDADGMSGTNPVTGTVKTRSDVFSLGSGNHYYVAKGGNDNNTGDEAHPWLTVQHVLNTVVAGDTVYIKAGTYNESLTMAHSGAADNYITIMNYASDSVIVDFGNAEYGFTLSNKSYVLIHGITFQNASSQCISISRQSNNNVVEYCTLRDFGYETGDAGVGIFLGSDNNLVQNNTIYSARNSNPDTLHRAGGVAMYTYNLSPWPFYTGQGNVIRYNHIYSVDGGLSDGVGGVMNNRYNDGPYKDCDIYGNQFGPLMDDGTELEGGDINVRFWDNTITYANSGWAQAAVVVGPLYVFRNVVYDMAPGQPMNKIGDRPELYDGTAYMYHNSCYGSQPTPNRNFGIAPNGGDNFANHHYLNNIVVTSSAALEVNSPSTGASYHNSFDYDDLYQILYNDKLAGWNGTYYSNIADFKAASSQETHGISTDPKYVSPANGDLQLNSNSPCIDKGTLIVGFNDANSPWPYKGNAPDMGAYEYKSGSPTNHPPVLDPIGNKTVNEGETLQFTISATDPDGDTLTYLASNLPSGASFNSVSRNFNWTPTQAQVGSYPGVRFDVSDKHLIDYESITISVKSNSSLNSEESSTGGSGSGGGGGGSGGGGGGGGGIGGSGTIGVQDTPPANTPTAEDISATGADSLVELYVPKGTIVKNGSLSATSIHIIPQDVTRAANPGSEIIGKSYMVMPSGTAFDTPVKLTFKYTGMAIPSNIPVGNLYIALWDPNAMAWTALSSTIDEAAGTISAPITSLYIYAVMAHDRPASFTVTGLEMAPAEVAPGETVIVQVEVNNQGDLSGTYRANLVLDNATVQTGTITLNGNSRGTVIINLTSDTVGEHKVFIGDMVATFQVKSAVSPTVFTVRGLTVNPLIAAPGNNINISATVMNNGYAAGTYRAVLSVDGIAVAAKEITVNSGESLPVTFSFSATAAGQHKVSIGGLLAAFEVQVTAPDVAAPTGLKLNSFSVTANYDEVINKLIYARIIYQMNETYGNIPGVKLILTVSHNGAVLEQIPLLALSQLQEDGRTGELNYTPSAGWDVGDYTFQTALYQGDTLLDDSSPESLTVTPESVTKAFSWWPLGVVIGSISILVIVPVIAIVRRRDMFRY